MHLRDLRAGDDGEHLPGAHEVPEGGVDALDAPADERRGLLRLLLVGLDRAGHAQERHRRALGDALDLQPGGLARLGRQHHLFAFALAVFVAVPGLPGLGRHLHLGGGGRRAAPPQEQRREGEDGDDDYGGDDGHAAVSRSRRGPNSFLLDERRAAAGVLRHFGDALDLDDLRVVVRPAAGRVRVRVMLSGLV